MKKIYSFMAAGLFLSVFAGCQKEDTTPPVYPEAPDLACVKIAGVWWAPVNCGYDASHTYGLLYQWGREYGQPYEAGTIAPATLTMEQGQDPAYKDTFGSSDAVTGNWFSGDVRTDLWNGSSKGAYDPCPSGWRVPTENELRALFGQNTSGWAENVGGQNGFYFNGTGSCSSSTEGDKVFLPAAGYRDYNDGSVNSRDVNGYYWSTKVYSYNNTVVCLCFRTGSSEMSTGTLAGGRPVRCVK